MVKLPNGRSCFLSSAAEGAPYLRLAFVAGRVRLHVCYGCMTSNFLYLGFSSFYYSSLRKTDTIVFAKLKKPPPPPPASLLSSPSNVFEINKPPGGLIEDLR